jgi:hypothetical protein
MVHPAGEDTAINIADLSHGTYVVENQADDSFRPRLAVSDRRFTTFPREVVAEVDRCCGLPSAIGAACK